MSRTVTAREALGDRLMHAARKEEVIQYLAAADTSPASRRRLYKEWCGAMLLQVRHEDLARVAPPRKPRERQLGLLPE